MDDDLIFLHGHATDKLLHLLEISRIFQKKLAMRWLAIFTMLLFGTSVHADTVSLSAVVSGTGQNTMGGAFQIVPPINASGVAVFLGFTQEQRGVLEFNLSPLPALAQIQSAQLVLQVIVSDGSDTDLSIFGYQGDGVLEATDFSAGSLVNQSPLPSSVGLSLSFDVTNFISSLQSENSMYAGVGLRTDILSTRGFASNTWSVADEQPAINIVYSVPEPPAVVIATLLVAMCYLYRERVRGALAR